MKTYTQHNFFKHTYCEFSRCNKVDFNQKTVHYTSKKGSKYHYTNEGVYRYANHWGRVANCRWKIWKIENKHDYKNQKYYLGFAKWTNFYPLNEHEKLFYISVDFVAKSVQIHHLKNKNKENFFLFSLSAAQKRKKQIKQLLTTTHWAKYFDTDILELRKTIITALISSDKTLQEIKRGIKN